MKRPLQIRWFLATMAAILLSACVTSRFPTQSPHASTDNLDSTIDAIVNDKSTWIDPADPL